MFSLLDKGGYANGGLQVHGSSSGSSSGATSPNREREVWSGPKNGEGQYQSSLPPVAAEVLRTAYERHRRGLMSPYMYQLLTQVCLFNQSILDFVEHFFDRMKIDRSTEVLNMYFN